METTSRVISVFGAKGGIGKTFVAVNTAAALRQTAEIAVVELDGSGDARSMLGATPVTYPAEAVTSATLPSIIKKLCEGHAFILIDCRTVITDTVVTAFEQSNLLLLVTTPDAISIRRSQEAIEALTSD